MSQGSLFACFVRRSLDAPDRPFAVFVGNGQERVLSHGEVLSGALTIARSLGAIGVERGALVVIMLEHSPWLYSAFIGCVLHGAVPTFLPPLTSKQDPALFQAGLEVLFRRIAPAALVTSRRARPATRPGDISEVAVDDLTTPDWADIRGDVDRLPELGIADVAFLQHSSGTTGHKKGVMLTHRQVLDQAHLYAAATGITRGDVIASWLPLYHDMGLITSFLIPTIIDCLIISLDALEWVAEPGMLLDYIERYRATFAWLPNFAFHHLAANDPVVERDLSCVRALVNCSEPCRAATFERFAHRYGVAGVTPEKLKVSYAMAENVFAVAQTPPGAVPRAGRGEQTRVYVSCGTPLPHTEIRILTASGAEAAPGELGEVCIRTSCLFDGYYRLPDLTRERLVDGWYHTRDLGCIEQGELFVVGRVDDLLIINGRNMFAHELEDAIGLIDDVAPGRVIVCGEYDEQMGANRLIVLAELRSDAADRKAVAARVRREVFSQCGMAPAAVRFVPRGFLVKSTSGKLSRKSSYQKWAAEA